MRRSRCSSLIDVEDVGNIPVGTIAYHPQRVLTDMSHTVKKATDAEQSDFDGFTDVH